MPRCQNRRKPGRAPRRLAPNAPCPVVLPTWCGDLGGPLPNVPQQHRLHLLTRLPVDLQEGSLLIDDVWRLKKITKDGVFHEALKVVGINYVQDSAQNYFEDLNESLEYNCRACQEM